MPTEPTTEPAVDDFAGSRRSSCACGLAELVRNDDLVLLAGASIVHGNPTCVLVGGQAERGNPTCVRPAPAVDPVDLFGKLVAEVRSGQVLLQLTGHTGRARQRAALDALALALAVLDDARDALVAEL